MLRVDLPLRGIESLFVDDLDNPVTLAARASDIVHPSPREVRLSLVLVKLSLKLFGGVAVLPNAGVEDRPMPLAALAHFMHSGKLVLDLDVVALCIVREERDLNFHDLASVAMEHRAP